MLVFSPFGGPLYGASPRHAVGVAVIYASGQY